MILSAAHSLLPLTTNSIAPSMLRSLLRTPGRIMYSLLSTNAVAARRPSDPADRRSLEPLSSPSSSRSRSTSAHSDEAYDCADSLPYVSSSPSMTRSQHFSARTALYIESATTAAWVWFYLASLEGGTVQSIQVKLPRLGTDVVLAVLLFTASLHLPSLLPSLQTHLFSRGRWSLSRALRFAQVALLFLLYSYDHGADLDHHGSYNLAIFFVIAAPLNAVLAGLQLWWSIVDRSCERDERLLTEKDPSALGNTTPKWLESPRKTRTAKRFSKQVIALGTVVTVAVVFQLRKYGNMWGKGIFPETALVRCDGPPSASASEVCSIDTCDWQDFSAWMDLIPSKSQNIWASPPWARTCKLSGPADLIANVASNGDVVVTGCAGTIVTEHTRVVRTSSNSTLPGTKALECIAVRTLATYFGPIVQEIPTTRLWSWDMKEMEKSNSYQDAILDHLATHTYSAGKYDSAGQLMPGERPHRVADETEAVIVKCGEHERIVSGVRPMSDAELGKARITPGQEREHDPLNVVVVFLDAVSRRHFFRRLPKTAASMAAMSHSSHLEASTESSNVTLVQLFRYLSVGYNTDPTTRALLGGQSRHSIHSLATPIWKEFADAGYVTGFAADNCQDWPQRYGSGRMSRTVQGVGKHTMSEGAKGAVQEPPAGTFAAHHEFEAFACMPEFVPILKSDRGNIRGPNAVGKRCIAGRHVHDIQLDWMSDFMRAYTNESAPASTEQQKKTKRPFFVMGSFMEGHEGTSESIALADESLARFLDPETSAIPWNNTMVLVVADHGLTLGLGRLYTKQGKVEERNPFGAIMLPDWAVPALSDRHAEGKGGAASVQAAARADLTWNEQRVVTAFDLHQTMRHVLNFSRPSTAKEPVLDLADLHGVSDAERKQALVGPSSARSILAGPLPDRTCDDVDVENWLCRCRTQQQDRLD